MVYIFVKLKFFMKNCITLFLLILFLQSEAQKTNNLYLSSGTSFAGSGDVGGFYVGTGIHHSNKRINLYYELATTLHKESYFLLYDYYGTLMDGSIYTTITGIQLSSILAFSVVKTSKNNLDVGIGGILRYQLRSTDMFEVQFPLFTGLSYPVVIMKNINPTKTLSIGSNFQVNYQYNFYKKFSTGIRANLHFDTNGDIFWNKGLSLSYRL